LGDIEGHMKEVNYIKHLNAVFIQFSKDSRLNPTHISLYMALFQIWNNNRFTEEFYVNRDEVMSFSKIGSNTTYHRCIKELDSWKYLMYTPSHNPFRGSRIKMFNFWTSDKQAVYQYNPKNEQALVSIYKDNKLYKDIKEGDFKNSNFKDSKEDDKQQSTSPNMDNLKVSKNKNYNEPL